MKALYTCIIALCILPHAWAGTLTVPKTFTANSPAVAADVNANFTAVKTAVNDNNGRITANTTLAASNVNNKQNTVTGTCALGKSIRVINANGSVTCEVDTDTTYAAGVGISISAAGIIASQAGAAAVIDPVFTSIPATDFTVVTVTSVTITVPAAGFALITHSGSVTLFNEPNTINVGIGATVGVFQTSVSVGSLDAITINRTRSTYSTQFLATIPAAGTYTYYGLAQKNATFNAGQINVSPQSITAIYMPNQY
ncbi:MAG: hypothetical protein Q9M19_03115 [Mariprofundaceae bacterium]|nr:hypothetical protein [Mariprofundaceae bacterium]